MAKRIGKPLYKREIFVKSSADIAEIFMNELKNEKKEKAKLVILNNKNSIIKIKNISLGSQNFVMIEPKEIFKEIIDLEAPKFVLIHNHPSGDPTPSKEDMKLTREIEKASNLLGISFLDHIVIGNDNYKSIFAIKEKEGIDKNV